MVSTLEFLLIGAIVGAAGQSARAIVGIEKSKKDATDKEIEEGTWWDPRRLYLSLFTGAVAGVLYIVVLMARSDVDPTQLDASSMDGPLLTLVGVGYAGTDFIEGVLKGRGRASGSGGGGEGG